MKRIYTKKISHKTKAFTAVIALTALMTACGADYTKIVAEPERQFYMGKPVQAARAFIPHINKSGKDQLLFCMEAGLMLHTGDNYAKSNQVFGKASKVLANMSTSITKQAASLFLNERSTNYKGEDFEKVLVHMYMGINYLMLEKPDSARVEFKKVNDELSRIKKQTGKNYRQNIMAKYLTAISYEMVGDIDKDANAWEYAYIEYKQIVKLNPGLRMVRRDLQRMAKKLKYGDDYRKLIRQYGKQDRLPYNAGELVVIYQAGRSAIKKSRGKLISDRAMWSAVNVSLNTRSLAAGLTIATIVASLRKAEHPIPYFGKRSNRINQLRIKIKNRTISRTRQLEDIETTAVMTLRDDYGRLYKKVAAGIVTKAVTALAAGIAAKQIAKNSGNSYLKLFSGLIGAAAGAGTAAALISQIKPDLRCWHSLPANLQFDRIFLRPGKYTLKLEFVGKNGAVARTETDEIEIKKGKKSFVNYRTLY